jgi:hypothetical protein
MPAKSQAQQALMGMVHAYQTGRLKNASKKVKDMANKMSKQDVADFASTPTAGLPKTAAAKLAAVLKPLPIPKTPATPLSDPKDFMSRLKKVQTVTDSTSSSNTGTKVNPSSMAKGNSSGMAKVSAISPAAAGGLGALAGAGVGALAGGGSLKDRLKRALLGAVIGGGVGAGGAYAFKRLSGGPAATPPPAPVAKPPAPVAKSPAPNVSIAGPVKDVTVPAAPVSDEDRVRAFLGTGPAKASPHAETAQTILHGGDGMNPVERSILTNPLTGLDRGQDPLRIDPGFRTVSYAPPDPQPKDPPTAGEFFNDMLRKVLTGKELYPDTKLPPQWPLTPDGVLAQSVNQAGPRGSAALSAKHDPFALPSPSLGGVRIPSQGDIASEFKSKLDLANMPGAKATGRPPINPLRPFDVTPQDIIDLAVPDNRYQRSTTQEPAVNPDEGRKWSRPPLPWEQYVNPLKKKSNVDMSAQVDPETAARLRRALALKLGIQTAGLGALIGGGAGMVTGATVPGGGIMQRLGNALAGTLVGAGAGGLGGGALGYMAGKNAAVKAAEMPSLRRNRGNPLSPRFTPAAEAPPATSMPLSAAPVQGDANTLSDLQAALEQEANRRGIFAPRPVVTGGLEDLPSHQLDIPSLGGKIDIDQAGEFNPDVVSTGGLEGHPAYSLQSPQIGPGAGQPVPSPNPAAQGALPLSRFKLPLGAGIGAGGAIGAAVGGLSGGKTFADRLKRALIGAMIGGGVGAAGSMAVNRLGKTAAVKRAALPPAVGKVVDYGVKGLKGVRYGEDLLRSLGRMLRGIGWMSGGGRLGSELNRVGGSAVDLAGRVSQGRDKVTRSMTGAVEPFSPGFTADINRQLYKNNAVKRSELDPEKLNAAYQSFRSGAKGFGTVAGGLGGGAIGGIAGVGAGAATGALVGKPKSIADRLKQALLGSLIGGGVGLASGALAGGLGGRFAVSRLLPEKLGPGLPGAKPMPLFPGPLAPVAPTVKANSVKRAGMDMDPDMARIVRGALGSAALSGVATGLLNDGGLKRRLKLALLAAGVGGLAGGVVNAI